MPVSEYSFMLRISKIEGIGLFAMHDIYKGTVLHEGLTKIGILRRTTTIHPLFQKFCIPEGREHMRCPAHFDIVEIWWFLNHSKTPNVTIRKSDGAFIALRNIKGGEEMVVDYAEIPFGGKTHFGDNR